MSEPITREFPLSDDIKDLGFSRIYVVDKTLFVCGLKTKIQCRYYKSGLEKTMKALKQALVDSSEYDKETIDKLCLLMTQAWVKVEEKAEDSNNSTTADNAEGNIIIEEIKELREELFLVLMVCRNICERLYSKIIVGKSPYEGGKRYCRRCDVYFYQVERFCQCCGMTLRTSPAGKNTKRNVN